MKDAKTVESTGTASLANMLGLDSGSKDAGNSDRDVADTTLHIAHELLLLNVRDAIVSFPYPSIKLDLDPAIPLPFRSHVSSGLWLSFFMFVIALREGI